MVPLPRQARLHVDPTDIRILPEHLGVLLHLLLRPLRPFFVAWRFGGFNDTEASFCDGFYGLAVYTVGRKLSDFGEGGGVEVEELRSRRRVGEEARETGRVAGGEEAVGFDRGKKML